MAFEALLARAGGAGTFQVLQLCTLLLPALLIPCHMLLENFSAAIPDHRCWARVLDNSSEVPANLSHKALLAVSIPPGPNQQPQKCLRFHHPQWQLLDPNASATNWSKAATEPCVDGWVYDHSTFSATTVTKWDLVCGSQSLKPMGQSIFIAGILAGSFICGLLSHRLGRKPMLIWCCLQVAVAGASTTLAPSFLIYCGLRFLSAFGVAGVLLAQSSLMAEWTTTCRRAVTMTILGCTYSTGQMALAGLAFALRDWRDLQLAVSVPFLVFSLMSCFFFMLSYYGLVLDLQSLGRDIFLLQTLFGAVDFLGRATTVVLLRFLGRRMTLAGSLGLAGFCILANGLVPQDLQTLRVALAVLGKGCFGISLTSSTVYKVELFPTSLRMTADGLLNSAGRLGAMMGPLIRMAHQAVPLLPPLTYGAVPIASSLVLLFLPETQGLPLPDTIQDLESRPTTARDNQREVAIMESTWL